MTKFSTAFLRTTALVALLGSFAAMPAHAQSNDAPPPPPQAGDEMAPAPDNAPQPPPAAGPEGGPNGGPMHHMGKPGHEGGWMNVEQRIKTLHDKLMITQDEESDWNNVAAIMRSNGANMKQLIEERHANPQTMTALDDLKSYQQIAQAHADGAQKMLDAFTTLYNKMPANQQKNADMVFGSFEGHRGGMMKHHHQPAM